jgi:hypothetical protein
MGSVPVGRKKRADATTGPQTFRSPTAVVVWWVWLLFAVANLIDLAVQGRDHLTLIAAGILLLVTGGAYVTAQRPRIIADKSSVTVVNPLRDHHVGWAHVSEVDLADLLRVHCDQGPGDQGRGTVIHAWSVQYSRRRKFSAEAKARRVAARAGRPSIGSFGMNRYGGGGIGGGRGVGYGAPGSASQAPSSAEADAERIVRTLSEYANAARAEKVWADGTVEIAGPAVTAAGPVTAPSPATPAPTQAAAAANAAAGLPVSGWLDPLTSTWSRTAILALVVPALLLLIACLV